LPADTTPRPDAATQKREEQDTSPEAEKKRHNWVPAYVLGGLSVAALGTSVGLRFAAGAKKSKVEDLSEGLLPGECATTSRSPQCDEIDSQTATHRKLATSSNVLLVGGGALAGAAIGWLVYELSRPRESSYSDTRFFPLFDVGTTGGTVSISGNF
jgi:hypothetical protein